MYTIDISKKETPTIVDSLMVNARTINGNAGAEALFKGEITRAHGRLQVLDVSDIEHPKSVAWYEPEFGGVNNVWVAGDTLYVGAYNAGFRAFDVSGELRGDLRAQGREIANFNTGAPNAKIPNAAMTWGAVVRDGITYANDLNSGLWLLKFEPRSRSYRNCHPERLYPSSRAKRGICNSSAGELQIPRFARDDYSGMTWMTEAATARLGCRQLRRGFCMRSFVFCAGLSLLAIGCVSDRPTGLAQVPASADGSISAAGVAIIGTVTGRSAAGDTVALRFVNSGPDTAYIPRCGADPLVLTQQFVNGTWIGGVQNFMCIAPSAPGPVRLDPGASVTVIRVVQAGRYRMTASVATKADLSNAMPVVSNAVDAP